MGGLNCSASFCDSYDRPHNGVYTTPIAVNVRPRCVFEHRMRGGSRPGLVLVGEAKPSSDCWVWPNGGKILWPDGSKILTGTLELAKTPDGANIVNPHDIPKLLPNTSVGAPSNASIGTFYRGRLVLAQDNLVCFSRTSDISDWNYGADRDDLDRAVAFSVGKADLRGDSITCLAAVDDSRLFICTSRETYVLSGNPAEGELIRVSVNYGCVSPNAWAWDGQSMYFLSASGLISISQGSVPTEVSYAIPDALHGLNEATCIYDVEELALHILTTNTSWFFINGTWWQQQYPNWLTRRMARINDNGIDTVAFESFDGNWYKQSRGSNDNGDDITSYVALGPIKLSDGTTDALLAELAVYHAANYGDELTVQIAMGKTAEDAYSKALIGNFDEVINVTSGFNGTWRTRARGAWCVIQLYSEKPWAYEYGHMKIKQLGRLR